MELQQLEESIRFVKPHLKQIPEVAIILGSGLGPLADELEHKTIINCADIPHYPVSTVADHAGVWVLGTLNGAHVLALKGRVHMYEGYSARKVTYSVRLMAKLGITRLVVTNASGGINEDFTPGDLMIIKDHINLSFDNPLIGDNQVPAEQRFIDMYDAYDKKYLARAQEVANSLRIPVKTGVLFTSKGPTYETAAEVRMARIAGADSVTMSTAPEVIAARQMNMRVFGISCITNMATGITGQKLSHTEVQETANRIKNQFLKLMKHILVQLKEW